MSKRNKKKIVIGILCCMLVFMGIGYAALSQVLNIGTTAKVTGSWNIYISSATVKEKSDADMNGTEITDNKTTDISLNVSFKKPSDYITYDITVENAGTIDAKLDEITMTPPSNVIDGTEEKMFLMETKNLTKGSVLKAGETATFQMTLRFNEKATALPSANEEFTFGLKLNYVQSDSANVDTSGTGGGTIPAEAPDFTVDDTGKIIGYSVSKAVLDDDGYLVIPATNKKGKAITTIGPDSFTDFPYNVGFYDGGSNTFTMVYTTSDEEFNKIKEIIKKEYSNADDYGNYPIVRELPSGINESDLIKCIINPDTGEIIVGIQKLDLSQATNLVTIEDESFLGNSMSSIKFNEGLKSIGKNAFEGCNLSEITLPSTITSIGNYAFDSINNLKTIIIKRANSDGMTLGDRWNGDATVVYDPS